MDFWLKEAEGQEAIRQMKSSRKSIQEEGIAYAKAQRQKRSVREGSLEEKVPTQSLNRRPGEEGIPTRRIEVGKGTGV